MRRYRWLAFVCLLAVILSSCSIRRSPGRAAPDESAGTDGTHPEIDEVIARLRGLLGRKHEYPYTVEYILALPAPPRTATVGERRKVIAGSATWYYTETLAKHWSSRILI